jgi:hypothetical protein
LKKLTAGGAAALPITFAAGLVGVAFWLRTSPPVLAAILGAAAVLFVWSALLMVAVGRSSRELTLDVVLRKPHYVQMSAQIILFTYWGWYVPAIRAFAPLVLAQLLFAYGFSALLGWSRRDRFELGFGPVPISLSINFFLLFKPDWFYWQFAIVALGFLVKEFIRWERDGRSSHIFNPSSFPLAIFSLVLILTGSTDVTLGLEIATTLFNPPNIFLVIFLVSLPGQILFGVATMTIAAVLTTLLFGVVFHAATGTYYFHDAYIPIAVFLGMHLLFTDPSTSPRTETGRVFYGVLYGLGTIGLAALLSTTGAPTFYDKLLPVPLLNLSVRLLDRLAPADPVGVKLSAMARGFLGGRQRLVTSGAWIVAFVAMVAWGGVGDEHEGQWVPFWDQACGNGSARACEYLAQIEQNFCEDGSGWACNELGVLLAERAGDPGRATIAMRRGCDLEFPEACDNLEALNSGGASLTHGGVRPPDLPILLRGSKGPIRSRDVNALYAAACQRGFPGACGSSFTGQ